MDGKVSFSIGQVSTVVNIGVFEKFWKFSCICENAKMNPVAETTDQKDLLTDLDFDIWYKPWIDETSKNSFNVSMILLTLITGLYHPLVILKLNHKQTNNH